MRLRADELNIDFDVRDVKEDLHAEIRELRRMIGKIAASYVEDGDTIILDAGTTTNYMSRFLRRHQHLTVISNSMEIFQYLHSYPNIELIMTGGTYDRETKIYTGRGAHLLLNDIRADKAFIAAGGVSPHFGISSSTANMAEIERSMIRAAREVIVLADHTILDIESNYHVADLDAVNTLITDAGIPASQNLELTQRGIKVLLAGRVEEID
jgi:DeoR family fructose operon transcriptional repressor